MRKKLKFLLTNCRIFGIIHLLYVPLAQAAEHLPFKQGVPGSNPGWHTTGSRPFFRLGRSLRRFFCASMSGETSKALAPVTGSAGVHSAGSRPFFRGHSPVFPSVTSVIDGIFLPRSRYSLLFAAVPFSENVQTPLALARFSLPRGQSPVFPRAVARFSVSGAARDGYFLPRSRYSLLFVTVPAPCYP